MNKTVPSFALPVVSDAPTAAAHDHHDHAASDLFEGAAAAAEPGEKGFGKSYWRSIEEKLGGAAYAEQVNPEFPEGADLAPTGVARREFLTLLGGSLALAGLGTACTTRPHNERMLPYTKTPQHIAPGNPLHYASGMTFAGHTSGLLVTAWEGRPTKVEGNPQHPINQGAAGVWEQAFLLSLYDPQRARVLRQGRTPKAFTALVSEVGALVDKAAAADGGARVRFLVEPTTSPLLGDLRASILKKLPNAKFVSYATADQDPAAEGAQAVLGQPAQALYDFTKADVILSLDADFLEARPANLKYARDFANRRDPNKGELNRLYAAEARYSLVGGQADHRARVKSAEVLALASAVAQKVGGQAAALGGFGGGVRPELQAFVDAVAADLKAKPGRSLVIAGERQPAAVHALAHALNQALGNVGQTVRFTAPTVADRHGPAALRELVNELRQGKVDTLVITAWNPVYAAPQDLGLAELLAPGNPARKNLSVLYTSLHEDETSALCDWFVPLAHELEAWGDGRSIDGTVTLVQPLIQPLYNGVPVAELFGLFLAEPQRRTSYQLLRDFWRGQAGEGDFETKWEQWVAEGFMANTASAPVTASVNVDAARGLAAGYKAPAGEGLELNFVTDYKVFDGRFANLSWLQELPDPVTKLTWDNAAFVSPATGERLGVKAKDFEPTRFAKLSYQGKTLELPVWITPGQADDTVVVALGYGRTGLNETVAKEVGANANLLRRTDAPWFDQGAKLELTDKEYRLAFTQHHWSMEKRPLALDMTVDEYQNDPEVLKLVSGEIPDRHNLLQDYKYEDYKWGMAIDLARCTGCSACVVACQAENNIPVVGREQVLRSREMQWLRIDRYFSDEPNEPQMVHQPVACVHCEKAPCEYVCPVNATVHSDEGLNDMVYNRCVGTRYCSNNCPYKVRRFNYLHYTSGKTAPEKMLMNPDVTVRNRGVMEKCTYCVQRIERVRIDARVEKRPIRESELKTACQQTCPTEAIVFGTLSDKDARVTKLQQDGRAYKLLHELGTKPRTAHLVRLRNPNKTLVAEAPKAHEGGH